MFNKQHFFRFNRLRNTLMVAFLVLSLVPLTGIALFFLHSHSQDLQEQSHSYLVSVRDTKQQQILDYIDAKESEVIGFVRSELAYASGGRFYGLVKAFRNLGQDIEQARANAKQRYVQGSGNQIKNSTDKTSENFLGTERYRLLHKRYHWAYVELLKRSDFDDILLVDLEGNVTYSVRKDKDYGSNLLTSDYKDRRLGQTFSAIKQKFSAEQNEPEDFVPVIMSDFAYRNGEQYAWFAAPIVQQGFLHSYAILRLPISGISELVKDENTSADILLVGKDLSARAEQLSSSVIVKHSEILQSALDGHSEVKTYNNRDGENIIAAVSPITFKGLNWAISVQLSENEAHFRVHQLEKVFVFTMLLAIVVVFFASHVFANFITDPLLKLTWAAEKVSAGDLDETVINTERRDEIGRLAVSFERMQRSIRDKILTIRKQNEELEKNLQVIQKQNSDLQLADKLKDEFLATTSHELRTPLHGMIGIAEALISGSNGSVPASQKYQLDIIISSGQRLSSLVDDLLDYHKMSYGNLDIAQRPTDLFSATSLVLQLSNHLLGNKRIRIINQVPIDLPPVSADPQRLEQVLYNLIGNAIKYTNEGKIVITASTLEHQVRIQIVDTGQGIPAEYLEHVFEPLIQTGGESSRYRQGAGLGLPISRQLIELMAGSLYVSSQPDVGTTFSFTLPIAEGTTDIVRQEDCSHYQLPIHHHAEEIHSSDITENPNGKLIIAADDEPVNLRVLASFLNLEGYRVKTASEGSEVLRLVEKEKPALLLLDIMMPGMSGYEVCKYLRTDFNHSELPIIMLTALNQTEDRVQGFESGANDYLSKPFNKQELAARITAHISASQADNRHKENIQLQKEIDKRISAEADLLATQKRLMDQLESAPEAIICLNRDGQIQFANEAASVLFRRTTEQLRRSRADEVIASKYVFSDQEHYCGEIDIFSGDQKLNVSGDILKLAESSGIHSMFIFDISGEISTNRVRKLETAIDALSRYAFEGDSDNLDKLNQLGEEFQSIAAKASGSDTEKQILIRQTLAESMNTTLMYWEQSTGKNKFDFAEQSGLWKVYLDRSTLQTRTLDKYLRVETIPKTPRWRTVVSSLDFVLENCSEDSSLRKKLEQLKYKLNKLVSS